MIKLLSIVIPAIVLLVKYLLDDKRKIEGLRKQIKDKEHELEIALSNTDVKRISIISHDLARLRSELAYYSKGKR
jgi:predicted Holliday junction resolvase-like endonuclease